MLSTLEQPLAASSPKLKSIASLAIDDSQGDSKNSNEQDDNASMANEENLDLNLDSLNSDSEKNSQYSKSVTESLEEKSISDVESLGLDLEFDSDTECNNASNVVAFNNVHSCETITEESKVIEEDSKSMIDIKEVRVRGRSPVTRYTYSQPISRPVSAKSVSEKYYLEPWPKDACLYQPIENEQILLIEKANCLAVEAYLKMCKLDYQIIHRANAEAMSPTGKVPFVKCGLFIVAELEGVVQFLSKRGISLTKQFDNSSLCDMNAYMSLIHSTLETAEMYLLWLHPQTYNEVTKIRYGSVYPWPLNIIQNWMKRRNVLKYLHSWRWSNKTIKEVYQEIDDCMRSLSDRLDRYDYFFGEEPTELDALVYGHVAAILNSALPNNDVRDIVRKFPLLVNFVERIDNEFFI